MLLSICSEPKILEVMRIVNIIITIIRIVVPIILIFVLIIKLVQAVTSGNEDGLSKVKKNAPKNIVAVVVIFFVPLIVRLIVNIVFPNSDYKDCLVIKSLDEINLKYEEKLNSLISKAQDTLNLSDYVNAVNYLSNIKDANKRNNYTQELDEIKKLIDEKNKVVINDNNYADVNYSNFKWTYYNAGSGPNKDYYSQTEPYAVWAPSNINDLNGVSLPLIVWLHGSGESIESADASRFLSYGLPAVVKNWKSYNLDNIPAIIVAPQSGTDWGKQRDFDTIKGLINYTAETYKIDKSKVVLMGHSMGGAGTYYVANSCQDCFSSIVMMSSFIDKCEDKYINFYKTIRLKGYVEENNPERFKNKMVSFFNQLGRSEDLTFLNCSHGKVPEVVLTTDDNSDGISDIIYYLFGKNEKGNTQQPSQGGGTGGGSNAPSNNCIKRGKYQTCSPDRGKYGSFAYYDSNPNSTEDRWTLEMDPTWARENFVNINKTCSNGWELKFEVHKLAKSTWEEVLNRLCMITTTGIDGIKYSPSDITFSGARASTVVRFVSGYKIVSNHSFGITVDINPNVTYNINGKSFTPYNRDVNEYESFVKELGSEYNSKNINYILWKKIFEPLGFNWGGNWGRNGNSSTFDGMHFEIDWANGK